MLVDVAEPKVQHRRICQGMYWSSWWNFELEFRGKQIHELDYPEFHSDFDCIGVCDSPQQLLTLLPKEITEGALEYVISVEKIRRDEQGDGGWRWHKWGSYIGTQKPTTEYLRDEPDIEEVWTYHVYRV